MCISLIFMTFDDFLNFDNIQKKVNWVLFASNYCKRMIEIAFESWNTILLHKKKFIEFFWFFVLIHTLLWCTTIKTFFAVFHQKMSKNADFWKLKILFQSKISPWLMIVTYRMTRHFKAEKLHFFRQKWNFEKIIFSLVFCMFYCIPSLKK